LAVALYGSYVNGRHSAISDIDLCIVLTPGLRKAENVNRVRLKYLQVAADDAVDVQVFQQLPLNIRSMILRDGKMLLVRDEATLYELASETVKDIEDFRKHYDEYLAAIADGKS
jgi:predicted nucleotidyltransferase